MLTLCQLALASLLYTASPGLDTVLLQDGGRLVGTVVEESPASGVTIQLPDGQLRTVAAAAVFRIEYRDGTFGVLGPRPPAAETQAAPPAPPAQPPPPPVAAPWPVYPAVPVQPSPPPAPRSTAPGPFLFAFGMGLAVPGGSAEQGIPMSRIFLSQFLMEMEGGLRFSPRVMGSLILDLGVGDAAEPTRSACRAGGGSDCSAITARFGLQLRYAFTPLAPSTPWISIGTAAEVGTISYDATSSSNDLVYSGWEVLRLGAGMDFRTSPGFGWGLFAQASWGNYNQVQDPGGPPLMGQATHAWVQAGARFILFP